MYEIDIYTRPCLHKQLTITGEQNLHQLARNHYKEVKAQLGEMKPQFIATQISENIGDYYGDFILYMKDGVIHRPRNRMIWNFRTMHEARLESYRMLKCANDDGASFDLSDFGDIEHLIKAENEEGSE